MDMCDRIVPDAAREYMVDSNEALSFKMVRTAEDVDENNDDDFFDPEMSHQVYGSSEEIYGYRNLRIQLYTSAGRLNFYCNVEHDGVVKHKPGELEPDKLLEPLSALLPPNSILDNRDTFITMLRKEAAFRPYGEQLHRFTTDRDGAERTFEVFVCDHSTPGFVEYFERLQMFVMFYVDAASFLDLDDQRWKYFLAFERYRGSDGNSMYAVAGFTVLYEFYAYPEHKRPRFSQMLVLPPFQKLGVGTALLEAVYKRYVNDSKVVSITVEDPSQVFGNMKLKLDCINCLELPIFQRKNLLNGITEEHFKCARSKLKLGKDSVRKVFNVLRLRATNRSNTAQYKGFRLDIKNQLYAPFRRQDKDMAKMARLHMSQEEMTDVSSYLPKDKRPEFVHQEFLEMEAKLMEMVNKLPKVKVGVES